MKKFSIFLVSASLVLSAGAIAQNPTLDEFQERVLFARQLFTTHESVLPGRIPARTVGRALTHEHVDICA